VKISITVVMVFSLMALSSTSFAGCNCDDWMDRGGYCVDYVKTKIPAFPIPKTDTEIEALKNRETSKVEEGDVAIFDLGRYWHVAYVEKVHTDSRGRATAIDVSEMNFGGQLSFDEYKSRWRTKKESEWKRALCCGVTKKYDQLSRRKNIAIDSVEQIWSPDNANSQKNSAGRRNATLLDKVKQALNQFIQFGGKEL